MIIADPRQEQVRETFWAELDERLPALNRALLRLEHAETDAPNRASALGELFREAHNLKAAARAVDHPEIEHAASSLEASLANARRPGEQAPAGAWFDAAYALVDELTALRSTNGHGTTEPAAIQAATVPVVVSPLPPTPPPTPPPPSPSPSEPPSPLPKPPLLTGASQPAVASPAPAAAHSTNSESVRVSVDKLDQLLTQTGELTVTHLRVRQRQVELRLLRDQVEGARREWRNTRALRAALRRGGQAGSQLESLLVLADAGEQRSEGLLRAIDELSAQLSQDTLQLGAVTRSLEEEVMAVRLLPIASVCTLLERTLRDLTRTTGKEAQLVVEGAQTEIDRKILEQIRDPLMHMLRNAVDHGIELPEARIAAGKPRGGTARLRVVLRGGFVEIEMSDDGAGLDPQKLRASAVRKGLFTPDQAAAMDDSSIMDVIFLPGFSTRTTVTELSGRGVGLDVVRQHVEQLNGHVRVHSEAGRGTRFELRVPLTLATTRAILLDVGGQAFALPSALIERSARVRQQDILSFEGRRAVIVEGRPVPVLELGAILECAVTVSRQPLDWRSLIILQQGERRLAVLTDNLVGEQEIVIKSLGWPLSHVPNVSGAAVLGSGQTVVILSSSDLLKHGAKLASVALQPAAPQHTTSPEQRTRRVLAVDDSLTTRTLMRSILEAAGYDVLIAADGVEALTILHSEAVDLVVSDVEMPRMDGYALTEAIRRDERLRQVPVVLVTGLGDTQHRERGAAAGADAYIVKRGFIQGQLLDAVSRLL